MQQAPMNYQFLRGTSAQNDAYVGPEGSISIDLEQKNIRVHDGATVGGSKIINLGNTITVEQILALLSPAEARTEGTLDAERVDLPELMKRTGHFDYSDANDLWTWDLGGMDGEIPFRGTTEVSRVNFALDPNNGDGSLSGSTNYASTVDIYIHDSGNDEFFKRLNKAVGANGDFTVDLSALSFAPSETYTLTITAHDAQTDTTSEVVSRTAQWSLPTPGVLVNFSIDADGVGSLTGTAVNAETVNVTIKDSSDLVKLDQTGIPVVEGAWSFDISLLEWDPNVTYTARARGVNVIGEVGDQANSNAVFEVEKPVATVHFNFTSDGVPSLSGQAYKSVKVDVVIKDEANNTVFEQLNVAVSNDQWSVSPDAGLFTYDVIYTASVTPTNVFDMVGNTYTATAWYDPDELTQHVEIDTNPHNVTKEQIGLGDVENYAPASDAEAEAYSSDTYATPRAAKMVVDHYVGDLGL